MMVTSPGTLTGVYQPEPGTLGFLGIPVSQNFFGITNYYGVTGYLGLSGPPYQGVFVDRALTTIPQITAGDGSSQTMLFGEVLGNTRTGTQNWNMAWIGAGTMPTAWGMDPVGEWYKFGGNHTAITQFCYADGSVRGGYTAQAGSGPGYNNFIYASGWQDGQTVNWDTFSN
jgi:hypothetical protein